MLIRRVTTAVAAGIHTMDIDVDPSQQLDLYPRYQHRRLKEAFAHWKSTTFSPRAIKNYIVCCLFSACFGNGTILVINPDGALYTNMLAVQNEGSSSAVICATASNGVEHTITNCSLVSFPVVKQIYIKGL